MRVDVSPLNEPTQLKTPWPFSGPTLIPVVDFIILLWQIGVSQMTVATTKILMEFIVEMYASYDDLILIVTL